MKKVLKIILIVVFFFFWALLIISIKNPRLFSTKEIVGEYPSAFDIEDPKIRECSSDHECISVPARTCGCTAGGENTAINKYYKRMWAENVYRKDIMCPSVMSTHESCFATPKCVKGKCSLL